MTTLFTKILMDKKKLINYFTTNLISDGRNYIGAEIETHFVNKNGNAISLKCSQKILKSLIKNGWNLSKQKNGLITELVKNGSTIQYELGRQNLELSTPPAPSDKLLRLINLQLEELYNAASLCKASPFFSPIIQSNENLLVLPDERDASWIKLDGQVALNLLAKTASVQFTIETSGTGQAITFLNILAEKRKILLKMNQYSQEELWKEYISQSLANYRRDRYGVIRPVDIKEYVYLLSLHDIVKNGQLYRFNKVDHDIDLFLRSIWWNFRLRRYSNRLCLEIRTLARRDDMQIQKDLNAVLNIIG